ncbi:Outer Dynein Arm Light Chain 1, partial [Phytophthora palmivora]
KLENFESIEPLFQISSLIELRLDSNTICSSNQVEYRSKMIRSFPALKHLDLKPLNDADRREAMLHANSTNKGGVNGDDPEAVARAHAISCVKSTWERRKISCVGYEEREIMPNNREESSVYNNNTGFSEVEVYGDYRVLVIYGNALEALELTKAHALVNAISFRYVGIGKIMTAATNANLKHFTRLRRLIFSFNDLQLFEELLWLSSVGSKAEEVFISNNPVCAKTLLKRFIGARISNALRLNGEEITSSDRQLGKQLFPKPVVPRVRSLESPELASKARVKDVKDMKLSRSSSTVASSAITEIFDTASKIEKKTTALDQAWKGILLSIVKVRIS